MRGKLVSLSVSLKSSIDESWDSNRYEFRLEHSNISEENICKGI